MTYQARYKAHQARKAKVLMQIMAERHSERRFDSKPVEQELIDQLYQAASLAPSSCNRKAIYLKSVTTRADFELLGGLLVGGVGWVYRAPHTILLFADPQAYGGTGEIDDIKMPQLDAGVMIEQILLMASSLGLAACYCNPNIRERNREHFAKCFGTDIFCGMIALGYPWCEQQ